MKQKRIFTALGALGLVFMLVWAVILGTVAKTLYQKWTGEKVEVPIVEMALCSEDAENLCVVNFGTNSLNRMVINFQLPEGGYDAFYAKARNRDVVGVYTCEVDEDEPTFARCAGLRTPLGETIDIEVYTTDGDKLVARGTFLVSAIALPTPVSLPAETPTDESPTEEPSATVEPFMPEDPFLTQEPVATNEPVIEEPTSPPTGDSTPEPTSP